MSACTPWDSVSNVWTLCLFELFLPPFLKTLFILASFIMDVKVQGHSLKCSHDKTVKTKKLKLLQKVLPKKWA